jgi:hypothetical protein
MFAMFGYMFGFFASQLPVTNERIDVTHPQFGLLLLIDDVGCFTGQTIAGYLSSRMQTGKLPPLLGAMTVSVAGIATLAPNATQFGITLLFLGICSSLLDIIINIQFVALGTMSGKAEAPFFHGLFSGGQLLGSGVGMLMTRARIDFFTQVMATAVILASVYLAVWPIVVQSVSTSSSRGSTGNADPSNSDMSTGQLSTQRRRTVILLAFIGLLSSVGEGGMPEWAGIYLRQSLRTSFDTANTAALACAAGMTVARLAGTKASSMFGTRPMIIGGGLLAATSFTVGLLINRPTPFLISVAITGAGLANITPLSIASLSAFPDDEQAMAVTRISFAQNIGFFSGPPIIGGLSALTGLRFAFLGVVSVSSLLISILGTVLHIATT